MVFGYFLFTYVFLSKLSKFAFPKWLFRKSKINTDEFCQLNNELGRKINNLP